ncbi:hypothetical protein ACQ4WX_28135 [Streptomyces lasalocidi]
MERRARRRVGGDRAAALVGAAGRGAAVASARCVREDERTLLCGTGAVAVDAAGELLRVPVRLAERSSEVTLEVETVWAGGAVDRDGSNGLAEGPRAGHRGRVHLLRSGSAVRAAYAGFSVS